MPRNTHLEDVEEHMAECPGLYRHAEAADGRLARIRLPGGRLDAAAARAIATAAGTLGNGVVELTGRGNLQVRGLGPDAAELLPRHLSAVGLCPVDPIADRRRNVIADPLAGLDPDEATDVSPLLAAFTAALSDRQPDLDALSPKVSFALDGGGHSTSLAFPHDAGLRAEVHGGDVLFRLSLAGRPLRLGVHGGHAVPTLLAIARTIARTGRYSRGGALTVGAVSGVICDAVGEVLIPLPAAEPVRVPPSFIGRYRTGNAITIGLATRVASITAADLSRLADLALSCGNGGLRVTPRRSILLTGIASEKAETVEREAGAIGLLTRSPPVSVVACSGRACIRGQADVRRDAATVVSALADRPRTGRPPIVHVSGCPRGCAHAGAADIVLVARTGGVYDLFRDARADESGAPFQGGVAATDLAAATRHALGVEEPAPATRVTA